MLNLSEPLLAPFCNRWQWFLLGGHPRPLFHLFSVFSNKKYKLYNKLMWKSPSSIRFWDSNSKPSDYESPPFNTWSIFLQSAECGFQIVHRILIKKFGQFSRFWAQKKPIQTKTCLIFWVNFLIFELKRNPTKFELKRWVPWNRLAAGQSFRFKKEEGFPTLLGTPSVWPDWAFLFFWAQILLEK